MGTGTTPWNVKLATDVAKVMLHLGHVLFGWIEILLATAMPPRHDVLINIRCSTSTTKRPKVVCAVTGLQTPAT